MLFDYGMMIVVVKSGAVKLMHSCVEELIAIKKLTLLKILIQK